MNSAAVGCRKLKLCEERIRDPGPEKKLIMGSGWKQSVGIRASESTALTSGRCGRSAAAFVGSPRFASGRRGELKMQIPTDWNVDIVGRYASRVTGSVLLRTKPRALASPRREGRPRDL
ncbi:hypothetical protein EVAR_35736_1 [Eumeta japonica]|uniref:Uncharacterized protein n=1 Tax=Eumeta variegata TaxID=151549 RepID=A0A4C1VG44_EUMVA|nr:hypothetical protein EVAR_35736_1 [Eumeta japonica]